MISTKRTALAAVLPLACAALLALSGCTDASAHLGTAGTSPAASSAPIAVDQAARALLPADIRDKGTLVIASDPSYAPFEFLGPDGKTMTGFDIALTDKLAEVLGVKAEHVAATFDVIIPGLSSGKYDVGMSAFSITPERQKTVDFVPYMQGGTALGVVKGNPLHLKLQDGSLCGHAIAVQTGTVQAQVQAPLFSKECTDAGKKAIDIKVFPTQSDANLALTSGRVDALISTGTTLGYQGKQAGDKFEVVPGAPYNPKPVGIAVKKGSPVTAALMAAMKDLMNTPEYQQTFAQWDIPQDNMLTAAQLEQDAK